MSWKVIDTNEYQIKETVALLELKNYFAICDTKCPVLVKHGDKGYWFNQQVNPNRWCHGETGPTGCTGSTICTTTISQEEIDYKRQFRPTLDERLTEVMIRFQTIPELVEQFTSFPFKLTANREGNNYHTWHVNECIEEIRSTNGIYKGDNFDTVYNSMLLGNPMMTEDELCAMSERHGLNLLEHKPYCGDEGCFKVYIKHDRINTGKLSVCFRILLCDLENNLSAIKNLFKYQR